MLRAVGKKNILTFSLFVSLYLPSRMSAPASGRTPVDYGVQIRFINDLQDTGGGVSGQPRKEPSKSLRKSHRLAMEWQ